jgi:hypothetical protein
MLSQEEQDKPRFKSIAKSEMHTISWNKVHRKKLQFKEQLKKKMTKNEGILKKKNGNFNFKSKIISGTNFDSKENYTSKRFKSKKQELKFSPLMQQYIASKKIIHKNCAPSFKINLTPYHSILSDLDTKNKIFNDKFNDAMKIAKYYDNKLKRNTLNKNLNKEINKIKFQALENSKRLHKRKIEETKYGAHEYANYILSILNSDFSI